MTRMAVRNPSFAQAAVEYEEAVGSSVSASSVWRMTQQSGAAMAASRQAEAQVASQPAQRQEGSGRRLPLLDPVGERANLSSDGGLIYLRGLGWKEVKIVTVSQVDWVPSLEKPGEMAVRLSHHSYQATLETAADFARTQYAEGVRRGVEGVETLSSVNDGAAWIERITQTNFPHAIQIVDWQHAQSHLQEVAQALWPQRQQRHQWLDSQLDRLLAGEVKAVIQALRLLEPLLDPDDPASSTPGYFRNNRQRMRYDRFRDQGLPIGSGTVESAVNNVIHTRMHRPGRGWKRDSASAMLALLSEYHSGRFNQAWSQAAAA